MNISTTVVLIIAGANNDVCGEVVNIFLKILIWSMHSYTTLGPI